MTPSHHALFSSVSFVCVPFTVANFLLILNEKEAMIEKMKVLKKSNLRTCWVTKGKACYEVQVRFEVHA